MFDDNGSVATVWTHYKGHNAGKSKTDEVYVVYITIGKMNELYQSWFSVAVNIEWDIR